MVHPHQSHIGLGLPLVSGLQSSEHQSPKNDVANHQATRSDGREEEGEELTAAVGTALASVSLQRVVRRLLDTFGRTGDDLLEFYLCLCLVGSEFGADDAR